MYKRESSWLLPQVGNGTVRIMQKSIDDVIKDWGGVPYGPLCGRLAEESATMREVIDSVYHDRELFKGHERERRRLLGAGICEACRIKKQCDVYSNCSSEDEASSP